MMREIKFRVWDAHPYMSGANDFEVEKPKKWVVRSKHTSLGDSNWYLLINWESGVPHVYSIYDKLTRATRFDTKEEAESWANSHQEVIEVKE